MLEKYTKISPCLPDRKVTINLSALSYNYNKIINMSSASSCVCFVKADAYGHGLITIVGHLINCGAKIFAVASPIELIEIRKYFTDIRVVVCSSYYNVENLQLISFYHGDVVIFQQEHITLLQQTTLANKLNVWLKINTGMNRMGVLLEDVASSITKLEKCANVTASISLMTHFACADDPTSDLTAKQIESFMSITAPYKQYPRCLANSAAILNYRSADAEIIRPGILLYGVSPLKNVTATELGFKPVMTLESKVVALNSCKTDDIIGYGATYKSPTCKKIAIVAIGYADGYPVTLRNNAEVLIGSTKCPIVGRVSMDTIAVDVSSCPNIRLGSRVVLWGDGLAVEKIALAAGTISYELLTRVSGKRTYYDISQGV